MGWLTNRSVRTQAGDADMPEAIEGEHPEGTTDKELYCTCRQPSFGEMVGCDNDDVCVDVLLECVMAQRCLAWPGRLAWELGGHDQRCGYVERAC
jgi:hypothetical protein